MYRNVKIAKALVMVARQLIGMSTNDNGRFAKMDELFKKRWELVPSLIESVNPVKKQNN